MGAARISTAVDHGNHPTRTLALLAFGAFVLAGAELAVLGSTGADESPGTSEALVFVGRAVIDQLPDQNAWHDAQHAVLVMPAPRSRDD